MISIFNIKTEEEYLKNKEYVDINELDNSERDALTVALKNSDIDKAKWLIKNGLNMNNTNGESFIYAEDYPEIQILMIKNGLNVNSVFLGNSLASSAQDINVIKVMIDHGLKCDFLNVYGESLLVGRDNVEIINLLIENGTNVNNRNNDSETALFRANETLTKELIKHGIDVNIVDNMGRPACFFAPTQKTLEMLKNAGADLTIKDVNDDNIVFYSNCTMSVKYLVEQGIDINHINKEGHNALSTIDISNENEKPFLDQLILHGICYEIYGKTKKEWEDRGLSEELFNYIKPLIDAKNEREEITKTLIGYDKNKEKKVRL